MSKERLEKAKELVESYETEYLSNHPMFLGEDIETLEWMLEQAERAQVLEENAQDLRYALGRRQEQNKQYREALAEVIDSGTNDVVEIRVLLQRVLQGFGEDEEDA